MSNRTLLSQAEVGIYAFGANNPNNMSSITLQYQFDVSSFRDPIGHKSFKGMDGTHEEVKKWILSDKRVKSLIDEVHRLVYDHVDNGKTRWLSIGFIDHHGKWISAAVAELVADSLPDKYKVAVVHDWR